MDMTSVAASALALSQAHSRQDMALSALSRDAKAQTAVASLLDASVKPAAASSGSRGQAVDLHV